MYNALLCYISFKKKKRSIRNLFMFQYLALYVYEVLQLSFISFTGDIGGLGSILALTFVFLLGKYHQYDAVIYPKPDENVVDKITRWLGLSHEQHKKLNHNTRRSMLALLPKWEGFVCVDGAESAAAWEMIQELEHVTSCLAPSFLTEKLEKDSSHIQPVRYFASFVYINWYGDIVLIYFD